MPRRRNDVFFALLAILYLSAGCRPFLIAPSHANPNRDHKAPSATFVGRSRSLAATVASDVDLDAMSVTELRRSLLDRGVDFRDCLEKRELVERLRANGGPIGRASTPRSRLTEAEIERIRTFRRASPCVAHVKTVVETRVRDRRRGRLSLRGDTAEVPTGSGSGFLWDDRGHVVTNFHVVAGGGVRRSDGSRRLPETVKVKLAGAPEAVDADIVGVEPEKDLAVLQLRSLRNLPSPIDVGTSDDLQVGQSVTAIGNPFGLDDTLTEGIVSALGREIDGVGGRPIHGCIQTDAAINPGNSGGPLLDSSGRLIGVNTAIFSPSGAGNVGIGFAIPVDTVRRVVNQIIQYGRVVRPTLGLSVVDDRLVRSVEAQIGRPLDGCLVAEVVEGGPADAAGVVATAVDGYGSVALGDLVVAVDGRPVRRAEDLVAAVEERREGETVTLTLRREADPRRETKTRATLTTRDRLPIVADGRRRR